MRHADAPDRPRVAAGPKGKLLFGSMRELQRDPLGLLVRGRAEHGDVVRFRYFGPHAWHLFAHPTDVEHILVTRYQDFPKGVFARVLDLFIPRSLVTTEGRPWARQRRLLQPGFSPSRLEELVQTIVAVTIEQTARWHEYARRGQPLDVSAAMLRLSFQAAGRTLLGSDLDGADALVERYVRLALDQINDRVLHPLSLLPHLPTPKKLAYRATMRQVDALVASVIERRRRGQAPQRRDLLTMLLESRHEDSGETMGDGEARDHVKTLLVTSYETTGAALGWLFFNLASHPEIAERVWHEVRSVVGDRLPTFADLPRLSYARQVIDETLRLYPPVFWLGRQAAHRCSIGRYAIPKNGVICVSPFVTHRHPDFWKTPDRFDPDNFEATRSARLPRGAYIPFGMGPRHCIGQHLALMEMLLILAVVVSRWRLTLVPGSAIEPRVQGTLLPSSPIMLFVEPRLAGTHPAPSGVVTE